MQIQYLEYGLKKKCFTDIYTIKDAQIADHKSILCASLLL
ncbi:hypothetical protein HMPREF0102_00823 [Bacteroides sp. 2_1_22]|nr:hypothetical protein HMPREF0102_00823 [Bacteroides sp. 2_1_22]CDM01083.1 hypothetical protein BN891_40140 [Bacteroides xylanisolvens SD CC 2a]